MLMKDPKKSIALLIASKGKMHPANLSEHGGEEDHSVGKHAAAEEMMNAIHAKDHKALAASLSNFLDMHESQEPEEPSSESSSVAPDAKQPDNASGYKASRES